MPLTYTRAWKFPSLADLLQKIADYLGGRKAAEDTQAAQAADAAALAAKAGAYSVMSVPGLEKETAGLTDHLATFQQVVDPSADLIYAKKLTGQIPPEPPPEIAVTPLGPPLAAEKQALEDFTWLPGGVRHLVMAMSSADPEAAAAHLAGQSITGMLALALAHTPGIVAEAASLGQIESVTWTIMDLTQATGLPDMVKAANLLPFEVGVVGPARYHYNQIYKPMQPGILDLPRMLARRQITEDEFLTLNAYQGYDGRWAAAMWNAFLRLPEWRDLQPMLWRGLIDDASFKDTMLRLGWHPDVVDEMLNLAWLIPGPADLIRFVVREVITPAEFITQMEKQGYGPGWAGAYWTAHFVLPAPNFLYDAFHRGIITDAELQKYIFWHDYMPAPRPGISKTDIEIMRGLTKTLIPRVDLRYAWELGRISDVELVRRYEWLGYEDDAALMADIQKARAMTSENTAISTAAAALYRDGYMDRVEFEGWLRTANFSQARIDKTLAAEDLRARRDFITDLQAMAVAAYQKDVFTVEELEAELIRYGMQPDRAAVLVAKEAYKKLPKPKAAAG